MGFKVRLPIVVVHMFIKKILPCLALLAALLASVATRAEEKSAAAKRCTVMAFNVENLFDLDAVSLYGDFVVTGTGADRWTPAKLSAKLSRLAAVLKTSENGRGPDVLILGELEADHTPAWAASCAQRRKTARWRRLSASA